MTVLISLLNNIAFKGAVSQKYKQYLCRRKKQPYITFKVINKEEFGVFWSILGKTGVISDTGLPRTKHFRFDFLATTCHTVIFEHSSMSCSLVRTWNAAARQSNF